jgi:hypothetical protein
MRFRIINPSVVIYQISYNGTVLVQWHFYGVNFFERRADGMAGITSHLNLCLLNTVYRPLSLWGPRLRKIIMQHMLQIRNCPQMPRTIFEPPTLSNLCGIFINCANRTGSAPSIRDMFK